LVAYELMCSHHGFSGALERKCSSIIDGDALHCNSIYGITEAEDVCGRVF
jgi:hypothetical protein